MNYIEILNKLAKEREEKIALLKAEFEDIEAQITELTILIDVYYRLEVKKHKENNVSEEEYYKNLRVEAEKKSEMITEQKGLKNLEVVRLEEELEDIKVQIKKVK